MMLSVPRAPSLSFSDLRARDAPLEDTSLPLLNPHSMLPLPTLLPATPYRLWYMLRMMGLLDSSRTSAGAVGYRVLCLCVPRACRCLVLGVSGSVSLFALPSPSPGSDEFYLYPSLSRLQGENSCRSVSAGRMCRGGYVR